MPPSFFAPSPLRLRQFWIMDRAFASPVAAPGVKIACGSPVPAVSQVRQIQVNLLTAPSLFAAEVDRHGEASRYYLTLQCGFRHNEISRCRFAKHHRGPIGELIAVTHYRRSAHSSSVFASEVIAPVTNSMVPSGWSINRGSTNPAATAPFKARVTSACRNRARSVIGRVGALGFPEYMDYRIAPNPVQQGPTRRTAARHR